jgi:predicted nucleotide-binding protein with TIR-like domain
MTVVRRVFVSGPRSKYLDTRTAALHRAILHEIEKLGYQLTAFGTPAGGAGLAMRETWNRDEAIAAMRRCVGAVLLGFPYWRVTDGPRHTGLATEYCHYEGALASILGLPVLALLESGTAERGAFDPRAGTPVIEVPADATAEWTATTNFQEFLANWSEQMKQRRDVFLGYTTSATPVAIVIRDALEVAGVTVVDWARDFRKGGTILSEVQDAAMRCTGAILLFTRDESLAQAMPDSTPPRDNVLLEAGYFVSAKGKERVLIVREPGAKMPADLGGDIYAALRPGEEAAVLGDVMAFVHDRL